MKLRFFFKQIYSQIIDFIFVVVFTILIFISVSNFSGFVFSYYEVAENPFLNSNLFNSFSKFIFKIVLFSSLFNSLLSILLRKGSLGEIISCIGLKGNIGLKSFLGRGLSKYLIVYFIPIALFLFNAFDFQGIFLYWIILNLVRVVFLLILKRSVFDVIYKNEIDFKPASSLKKIRIRSVIVSSIIDLGVIYSIAYVLHTLLLKFIYPDFFNILILVFILYQVLSLFFEGRGFGKVLVGISYDLSSDRKSFIRKIRLSIILKIEVFVVIPYLIMYFLDIRDPYAVFMNIIIFSSYLSLVFFILLKDKVWDKLAGISSIYSFDSVRKKVYAYLSLSLIIVFMFLISMSINNKTQENNDKLLGFNFPYLSAENNNYNAYKEHSDWLEIQTLSPKDYILDLYKRYDVVIIHEKFHGESSQWDFISEIVMDTFFINNVGVVFTEYGSIEHQDRLDGFLNTKYASTKDLEKETACLMTYMSSGYYYFLKNVNLQNNLLADSLKLKIRFTDMIDWDYFTSGHRMDIPNVDKRDSIMAQVVIDWYDTATYQNRKNKCLVVTNYRHAFGYPNGKEIFDGKSYLRLYSGNEGQYIYESIKDKTANVLQAGGPIAMNRIFFIPFPNLINSGVWDAAFRENNYKPIGFNLSNSPFGEDRFDMYPLRGGEIKYKYKDFFTGVVFNKPYRELETMGYPYREYAAKKEMNLKKTSSIYKSKNIDYSLLQYYKDEPLVKSSFMEVNRFTSISNLLGIVFLILFSALSIIFSTYHLIIKRK